MTSRFRTIRVSDPAYEPEGLRFLTFKSPALGARADVAVFLPAGYDAASLPRLMLLHGVYGSHWHWAFRGGVHRIASEMVAETGPIVLVMPSDGLWGDGSGYVGAFERYLIDDVPDAVAEAFGAAGPLFLGGLSMGGFGALRLGARHADKVRAISAHSSVTELEQLRGFVEEPLERYGPVEDPTAREAILRNRATLPPLRFDCGRADSLLEANRKLHRDLEAAGVPHVYEEFDGAHDWGYWSVQVRRTLRFVADHSGWRKSAASSGASSAKAP